MKNCQFNQRDFEAYEKALKENNSFITYITYREIFALAYFIFSFEEFAEEIKTSEIYKKEIKRNFNNLYKKFSIYKLDIKDKCFENEDDKIFKKLKEKYVDLLKLRFTINNMFLKENATYSDLKSYAMYSYYLSKICDKIHNENKDACRKINVNLQDFMSVKPLSKEFYLLILQILDKTGTGKVINLDTIEIVNGLKIIEKNISDVNIIKEFLKNE